MRDPFQLTDPSDVAAMQRAIDQRDPERRLARIGMSRIEIGADALGVLPEAVAQLRQEGPVGILSDRTPMRRGAEDLKPLVVSMLASRFEVRSRPIGSSGHELHADEKTISTAQAALAGAGCIVAVGSGTLTDISKVVSERLGHVPLVVVQTAASVNGFADNMSVILRSGVKRTRRSRWPDVLLVDLQVLASAPPRMNHAGFGDLLGFWTAPVDWKLASILGMDPSYHPAPVEMLRGHEERLVADASALSSEPVAGLGALASALTLSGLSMGIAGSTAPASGTEHLISHLIDIRSTHDGEPLRLHGAQVGVATVIAAQLWARFLSSFDPGAFDVDRSIPDEASVEAAVLGAFADFDPSGAVGAECWHDCANKLAKWKASRPRLEALVRDWSSIRAELAAALKSPQELARALREAGAVTCFADLEPGVTLEAVRWAVERLPFMRERFTIADLFFYSGRWNKPLIDEVIDSCRDLGIVR
jgi:glycerol-1-phosphate dehydrogenase [NAD(P)+]